MFRSAFFDDGNDGVGILLLIESFAQASLGCFESGEIGVGHEQSDAVVAVSFEEGSGMEGGSLPVFINEGNLNVGLGIASDESGNGLLVEPLLHGAGTLVENPGVGFGVLNECLEFAGRVFEVEESGRDELEFVASLIEEFAEGIEFHKHPWWELGEVFRGKVGDTFGSGLLAGRDGENLSAFTVLAGRDSLIGFEDFKRSAESVASDLKLGCEGSFAGKPITDVSLGDHFLDYRGSLDWESLPVRDSWHAPR